MRKFAGLLVVFAFLALAGGAAAQGPGRGSGVGPGRGPWLYNPQTVTTVKGAVESLGAATGRRPTTLVLKTDQGSLEVHLGPAWYLQQQNITLKAGDPLEVTGSQVTLENKPVIIAREIIVNGRVLKLRDEQGLPLWRRGRPGASP